MAIPISYNIRNMKLRKGLTVMTALGIALTVTTAVFIMALLAGLDKAFKTSGNPLNVLVLRKGSTSELTGPFPSDNFQVLKTLPGIAKDSHGDPLVSGEITVVIVLPRKDGSGEVNVTVRGMMQDGLELRPAIKLAQGRWFTPGQREVVVSKSINKRFSNSKVGDALEFGKGAWQVVGVFDAGGTAAESEIWGDVNQMTSDFDRQGVYSSAYLRATDAVSADALKNRVRDTDQIRRSHPVHRMAGGGDHGHRLEFRRHEHHVRRGGLPLARDRDLARDWILAAKHSDLVCVGGCAALVAGCRRGDPPHAAVQRNDHGNSKPGHVQRSCLRPADDSWRRGCCDGLCPDHGIVWRNLPRVARFATRDSGRVAGLIGCVLHPEHPRRYVRMN